MRLSYNDVEWVISNRHVYAKLRRWAGVISLELTLLIGHRHKTWHWKL